MLIDIFEKNLRKVFLKVIYSEVGREPASISIPGVAAGSVSALRVPGGAG